MSEVSWKQTPNKENGPISLNLFVFPCQSTSSVCIKESKTALVVCMCMCVCVLRCVQLFAIPWPVAHQAPLSMGILQPRIMESVAMPSSRGSSQPRDQTHISCVSCMVDRFFTTTPPVKPQHTELGISGLPKHNHKISWAGGSTPTPELIFAVHVECWQTNSIKSSIFGSTHAR